MPDTINRLGRKMRPDPDARAVSCPVSLPTGLLRRLDATAIQRGCSRSEIVREALTGLLRKETENHV